MESGNIECGGNAFAYSGYFREKNVAKEIDASVANVPKQLVKQESECTVATKSTRTQPSDTQLLQQQMEELQERILLVQQQLPQLQIPDRQQDMKNQLEQLQKEMKTLENLLTPKEPN